MTRPAGNARAPGFVGMSAVLLGGAAVLVAIIALNWYEVGAGTDSVGAISFRGLADSADRLDVPGVVPAYFDWLAWVLLIGLIAVGMLANAPTRAASALRAAGLLLGVAACLLTYYALQEIKSSSAEATYAFDKADAGVWVALGGFLLAGVGAAIGPRRV